MEPTTALLPAAHRVIRPVDKTDSAFAGVLVADGVGVRVRVDVESIGAELWSHGTAEHIAGVRDLIRRVDGHDALLPWCTEQVSTFLRRRDGAGARLTQGEAVTLVGSMLRGLGEAGTSRLVGVWWLADDARPLFVPGEGEPVISASRAVVGLVRGLIADRALDRVLADVERMPDDPRVVLQRLAAWESGLTAHAAPRALQREVFAPEPVAGIPLHRAHVAEPLDATGRQPNRWWAQVTQATTRGTAVVRGAVGRLCAPLLQRRGEGVARAGGGDATPRRERAAAAKTGHAPRRRIAVVAAVAVGAVFAVGMLWPQDAESSRADDDVIQTADSADVSAPPEHVDPETEGEPDNEAAPAPAKPDAPDDALPLPDAVAAATTLIGELDACRSAGDVTCASAVAPGGGERVLAALMPDITDATVSPVEDYGDVAVVRIEAAGSRQMLVLMRMNDSWLVRDVYDVADQP